MPLQVIRIGKIKCTNGRKKSKLVGVKREERAKRLLLMGMLLQKEKDLELAAKIGQSLLEQNRELQNRNDFLEESLNASNETVVQLRHELQMRINLLHVYADYDDYNEALHFEGYSKLHFITSLFISFISKLSISSVY
ncbi:unnamed protein product [Anisakis simplex]|uniref:HAP1 N-terminal domain-containing protein n=1 Tax=Anisakis simplex TaxID=6269 RepID=A0A0M3J7D7_ANISI|nr:unnamed protein product [Anisakis simplex]